MNLIKRRIMSIKAQLIDESQYLFIFLNKRYLPRQELRRMPDAPVPAYAGLTLRAERLAF
jgi:hypothetical protein